MTESDFNSNFRNLLNEPLPPAPDPRHMAFELFQRDQRRTRILAGLSLLFWALGTAGIFLLVFNLNRIVMQAQIHSFGAPHPPVFQKAPDDTSPDSIDTLFHDRLPPIAFTKIFAIIEVSVVALLIAALLTVALVFSSRQATLNRINISLMQIADQLSQAPPGAQPGIVYSLPAASGRLAMNALMKVLIALVLILVVGVPLLWIGASVAAHRARQEEAAARARAWHGYPRLSPFEAVRWRGQTPQVQVRGKWYEFVAMNGLSANQIVALCQALDNANWQKRFEEDLVEVLMRTGYRIGNRATLELKDLETGQIQVLTDVPMTEENREALWHAGTTRPGADR